MCVRARLFVPKQALELLRNLGRGRLALASWHLVTNPCMANQAVQLGMVSAWAWYCLAPGHAIDWTLGVVAEGGQLAVRPFGHVPLISMPISSCPRPQLHVVLCCCRRLQPGCKCKVHATPLHATPWGPRAGPISMGVMVSYSCSEYLQSANVPTFLPVLLKPTTRLRADCSVQVVSCLMHLRRQLTSCSEVGEQVPDNTPSPVTPAVHTSNGGGRLWLLLSP